MPIKLICASHTPLMDHVPTDPDVDADVRRHFRDLSAEVTAYDPELIIIFAPDHFKCVFYDMMPPFTVGARADAIGDYDIGGGALNVPEALAEECVRSVRDQGVDVAISYKLAVDHGFAQMLDLLTGSMDKYPVLPVHINCAGPPLSPMGRIRALGLAIGHWALQTGLRVLVLGSGGLSHDPPIPKLQGATPEVETKLIAGHNPSIEERRAREQQNFEAARALARGQGHTLDLNPEWDRMVMAKLAEGDLTFLDDQTEEQITQIAGCGGHEIRNWVAAYAALSAAGAYTSQTLFYHDIHAWNAGMGISKAEPLTEAMSASKPSETAAAS